MNVLAYIAAFCVCALPVRAEQTLVFAAASLKEPLDQLVADTENVTVSYGGSGALARQISLGAPADVVILANVAWMDVLEEGGALIDDTRVDLLSNRLVLVSNSPEPIALTAEAVTAALGEGRLAMGLTASVPAGIYGRAALEHLGLWSDLQPRLAEVDNVRAALALVAMGEAPLGIVYATDVRVTPGLQIAATFPSDSHPPIRYVAALLRDTPSAVSFLERLQSAQAQSVFESAGFMPVSP